MDAGDYRDELSETEGKRVETDLLEAVKEDIAKEKRDGAGNVEYCPTPGTQTLFDMSTKQENGLDYYKIAISCNVSQTPGYASHMTHIEVNKLILCYVVKWGNVSSNNSPSSSNFWRDTLNSKML